jgi:homoserine dehydrogenase
MRLLMIGFGVVGQALTRILHEQADELARAHDFMPQIVGVATRQRGTLAHPGGLNPVDLLAAIRQGHLDHYPDQPGLSRGGDTLDLIHRAQADVLIEVSASNLQTAQPALDYCRAALDSGKHVIMANKGPMALAYPELAERAERAERFLGFEATVMAGTPSLRLGREALAGCRILAARGILNGTTNYILTQMTAGLPYAEALAQAQALGYAEADPTADVEGWDAAGKALILASVLFDRQLTFDSMAVRGISGLTAADIAAAQSAGERWKLIAEVTPDGAQVQPVRLPISHPLAQVSGATNAITYTTDLLGEVTLIGPGAGPEATAFGLLADLLAAQRQFNA